jgi:hypothetical protein
MAIAVGCSRARALGPIEQPAGYVEPYRARTWR